MEEHNPFESTSASTTLVRGVRRRPVVQDRTELQLSDGQDDGITTDPPPAR